MLLFEKYTSFCECFMLVFFLMLEYRGILWRLKGEILQLLFLPRCTPKTLLRRKSNIYIVICLVYFL